MRCETLPSIVCACLNNQVYCYGGEKALNSQQRIDSGIYALYLNKTQRLDQIDWEFIKIKNDFLPGERSRPQFAVISNGTQLLIEGGSSTNDTIIYNALENTWQSVPNNSQIVNTNTE